MTNPEPQDWTPYWQRPTITSFGNLFPDNYDGSILEFWKAQLTGEPDHVVDIACGNGALTWIANRILNRRPHKTRINGKGNHTNVDRRALILHAGDALRSHIERIEDLEASALSADDRRHLVARIERAGFDATEMAALAYKQESNVGTKLVAARCVS